MPGGIFPLSLHAALPISWNASPLAWTPPPDASGPSVPTRSTAWKTPAALDRKSTRLNSSHLGISDAGRNLPSFPTRRSSDLLERFAACMDTSARRLGSFSADQEHRLEDSRRACADMLTDTALPTHVDRKS